LICCLIIRRLFLHVVEIKKFKVLFRVSSTKIHFISKVVQFMPQGACQFYIELQKNVLGNLKNLLVKIYKASNLDV